MWGGGREEEETGGYRTKNKKPTRQGGELNILNKLPYFKQVFKKSWNRLKLVQCFSTVEHDLYTYSIYRIAVAQFDRSFLASIWGTTRRFAENGSKKIVSHLGGFKIIASLVPDGNIADFDTKSWYASAIWSICMHSQASIVLGRCHYVQPCVIMIMCNSTGPVQTILHIISCVHHWNGSLFHVALLRLGTFLLAAWTINLRSTPEFQLCSAHHSCHSSLAYIIKIERTTPTDSKGASNNTWEYTVACYHLKHLQFKCRVSSAALKCCLSEAAEATPATSTSPVFVVFLSKPAGYGKSMQKYWNLFD